MNKYNIEHIAKLRIHELRDFARSMGVSSPTTMKKEELITRINEKILNGDNSSKIVKNDEVDFFTLLTSDNPNLLNDLINQCIEKDEKKKSKNQGYT